MKPPGRPGENEVLIAVMCLGFIFLLLMFWPGIPVVPR